nr:MAG TPA: hypothetical protein [Caudoviricetes sp.]
MDTTGNVPLRSGERKVRKIVQMNCFATVCCT